MVQQARVRSRSAHASPQPDRPCLPSPLFPPPSFCVRCSYKSKTKILNDVCARFYHFQALHPSENFTPDTKPSWTIFLLRFVNFKIKRESPKVLKTRIFFVTITLSLGQSLYINVFQVFLSNHQNQCFCNVVGSMNIIRLEI